MVLSKKLLISKLCRGVNSHGQELREREDGRKGGFGKMAKGQPGFEERGSDLRADVGRDGKEALQRGILCASHPLEAAVLSVLIELMKEKKDR